LLTESEVQLRFRKLIKSWSEDPETSEKLEALIDNLRAESPLRHRLSAELDEVRRMQGVPNA